VSHGGETWCAASTTTVKAGAFAPGTRVVLVGVSVDGLSGTVVTLSSWSTPICPPGLFCGTTLVADSIVVDLAGLGLPPLWHAIDLYATTGAPGELRPLAWTDLGYY
jgi:hypothetical protein